MALKLITPPAVEPLALDDVEAQIRADLSAESALVALYIAAIREKAEAHTRRALITQTWELVLDEFPCIITLPMSPLQSVVSIKYIALDGTEQTLDPATYHVDMDSEPARIVPAYGLSWISGRRQPSAVRVRFICGYGDTAADIPAAIRQWMLLNVANLYENRETIVTGSIISKNDSMADGLIDSYRIIGF